jgi:hypothetical protein
MNRVISSIKEFKAAKSAFVAKHGVNMVVPTISEHDAMLAEIAPLARFSKIPPDKLLTCLANRWMEENPL